MSAIREPFFINQETDMLFDEQGYVIDGFISTEMVEKLKELFERINIPDSYGFGFNVGLNTAEKSMRRIMQDEITALLEKEITSRLSNKYIFTATFMNKHPENKHLLPPHQDWTYTDENRHDSVMCWIPLVDVDMHNGCMCFVPYSNKLFNYIRPFPFPFRNNPVYRFENELIGFMKQVPMKAGQMAFINHKTAHASFPNYSNKNRLAVGLSIAPKDQPLHVYCLNPVNKGETMFKYLVDRYFLVNHHHPEIAKAYSNGEEYQINYVCEEEQIYKLSDYSWDEIYDYFTKCGLHYNHENLAKAGLLNNQQSNTQKVKIKDWIHRLVNRKTDK